MPAPSPLAPFLDLLERLGFPSEEIWSYRQSIGIVKELMNGRMYPTTLNGLERAMKLLAK